MIKIKGGKELSGTVRIGGSKNAALPVIAATVLIGGRVILTNVPHIGDVNTFLEILEGIGVSYTFAENRLEIDSTYLKESDFHLEKIKKIRASILLLGPLLTRLGQVNIPTPGGCNLGKRSIGSHLDGLAKIGYNYTPKGENICIEGKAIEGDLVINAGFGVTPTENLIIANVMRKGTTTIELSAIEPHVMNLIDFLRKAGANISIRYDHTIIIEGVHSLKSDFEFEVVSDYLQSGAYMVIGALISKDYLTIQNARIKDLYAFIEKLKESGVRIESLGDDTVRVYRARELKPVSIQTNIFPGFPTDIQSPFAILMTQAIGQSKIHEILFEGRLNWLIELEKMGGHIANLNPHEAMIFGQTDLQGATVTSWDLRAGCAMVIAGLIAEGETIVNNVEYINRGYEDFFETLNRLGADIEEIED